MTLQLHNVLDTTIREYDAKEALFAIETELTAGTYCISYNPKLNDSASFQYYSFTVDEGLTLPIGTALYGSLTEETSFLSPDRLTTYGTTTFTRIGTTQPTDIPYLGKINYARGNGTGGYSYYKQAGIRFFLNGENDTLTNWSLQHPCDIAPSYINSPGFLYQIDPDFRKVIGPVKKVIINPLSGEHEEINDLIFLLSREEVYAMPSYVVAGEVDLGSVYEYYQSNSTLGTASNDADTYRIKYDNEGIAYGWYLREGYTINQTTALIENNLSKISCVLATGSVAGGNANLPQNTASGGKRQLAPCCCIV